MINISLTSSFVSGTPIIQADPRHFLLQLGPITNTIIPSSSKVNPPSDPQRDGGTFQINLRPDETFSFENEVFQSLVENATQGGDTSFLTRILYLIDKGVIQITQDGGPPLTAKAILAYTAP